MSSNRTKVMLALLLVLALLAVGCGSGGDELEGIVASDGWARPTAEGAAAAGFFAQFDNHGDTDDRVVGAASDRCAMVQTHFTTIDDDGVAKMTAATEDLLAVPAADGLTFEPGALHFMCMEPSPALELGDEIELEVQFNDHEPVTVAVTVETR